jgi:transcriptional regulator with XRE-family HTH domain
LAVTTTDMQGSERPKIGSWQQFGAHLKAVRTNQQRTQTSVSVRAGSHRQPIRRERISEIENARRDPPGEHELCAILTALQLPPAEVQWLQGVRASLADVPRVETPEPPRRRHWRWIALIAAAAVIVIVAAVLLVFRPASPGAIPPVRDGAFANRFVQIINARSGKCLDKTEKDNRAGTRVMQWSCWGADNQRWNPARDGVPNLQHDTGNWLVLTLANSDPDASLQVSPYESVESAQLFAARSTGISHGWHYLTLRGVDSGNCLAVRDSSLEDGAGIVAMACTGGPEQSWRIRVD